jgi:H+/Cl- antiporter ClcA
VRRHLDLHLLSWFRNRPVGEKRFLLAVPAVGITTGLAAAALVHLVAFVQDAFWGSPHAIVETARGLTPLHRFAAPFVGGVIVAAILLLAGGAIRGHGTAGIIEAVVRGKSRLPIVAGLQDIAAIVVTVGSFFLVQPLVDVARDAAASLPF